MRVGLFIGLVVSAHSFSIQAETGTIVGSLPLVQKRYRGFSGTGYLNLTSAGVQRVHWIFNAPESGTYKMDFRYALAARQDRGFDAFQDSLKASVEHVNVDFSEVKDIAFKVVDPNSWSQWGHQDTSIRLVKGQNRVDLSSAGIHGPLIDSVTFTLFQRHTVEQNGCPTPFEPQHGTLTVVGKGVGSIARVQCKTGYRLSGPFERTCEQQQAVEGVAANLQSRHQWSGVTAFCIEELCSGTRAPPLANGKTERNVKVDTEDASTTYYSCDEGFVMDDCNKLTGRGCSMVARTCKLGVWQKPAPVCHVDCGTPPTGPLHTTRTFRTTRKDGTATYSCAKGYQIDGVEEAAAANDKELRIPHLAPDSHTLTCNADGKWSPDLVTKMKAMKCTPVTCGPPTSVKFGSYATNGQTYGSVATYQCAAGYQLMGKFSRTSCQDNGQWTAAPLCTQIKICSHIGCNYQKGTSHNRVSIAVTHRQAEQNGDKHQCSVVSGACMCLCWKSAQAIAQEL